MPHTLRTPRLLLRPPSPRDAPALSRALNDEAVLRETEFWSYPSGPERTRWMIMRAEGAFTILAAGEPIGFASLARRRGAVFGLGYMIGMAFWGRGYATEAAGAVCAHGFRARGAGRIEADVFADNAASARVLERLGFAGPFPVGPGWSASRGACFPRKEYVLTRTAWANGGGATKKSSS